MKRAAWLLLCLGLVPAVAFAAEEAPVGADLVGYLIELLPDSFGGAVTLIISICAAVAAFWSRPADDANIVVRVLYAVVNAVAFNKGKAVNADDAAASATKAGK